MKDTMKARFTVHYDVVAENAARIAIEKGWVVKILQKIRQLRLL